MSNNIATLPTAQTFDPAEIMGQVLLAGDLSKLSHDEKTRYLIQTCSSLGLNPLTKPFDYIRLSGREVLYATKGCADQLRKIHRISLEITDRKISGDLMVVTVRATTPDGRVDEDMGVIPVKGLSGEALSNAMLKAVSKAKRRVTLSICGLGMLDESEVRSAIEAEALAGSATKAHGLSASVSESPRPKAIAAPAAAMPPEKSPTPKPPLLINLPHGWEPVRFERTRKGLTDALRFLADAVIDRAPEVIGLNNPLLDLIAEKMPEMAGEVSELRAAAAEAMAAPDDGEPGAFDPDEERDDFGLPPLRQDPEVSPFGQPPVGPSDT